MIDDDAFAKLLDAHAPLTPCALVPALSAWHAVDEVPLWSALERALGARVDAPFFCVAWPGAQALARAIVDGVVDVRGLVVADVGCGSGLAAVAAARHGAKRVLAVDVDPLAVRAAALLAARTLDAACASAVLPVTGDALADPALVDDADLVIAGDLVSHAAHVDGFHALLARVEARARRAILADSGRPFFDAHGRREIARYDVDVPRSVDGAARRTVRVYA